MERAELDRTILTTGIHWLMLTPMSDQIRAWLCRVVPARGEIDMKALAEIQVIPIGVGVSVRKQVMRAHEVIKESGLKAQLHAYGTNVEGELGDVLATIEKLHETLHAEGVPRLSTMVKLGTRTDKDTSLEAKVTPPGTSGAR